MIYSGTLTVKDFSFRHRDSRGFPLFRLNPKLPA